MIILGAVKKVLCGSGSESVISPEEVAKLIMKGAFILDVRTMFETKKGIAPGATAIPLIRLKRHLDELPRDREIAAYCQVGQRGYLATRILRQRGFTASNIGGGYKTYELFHPTL